MENKVQHVTKASSDQLLSKFAEMGSESDEKFSAKKDIRLAKRRKRGGVAKECSYGHGRGRDEGKSLNGNSNVVVERKALLNPVNSRSSGTLIRRIGIGRGKVRVREFKNKSIMGTIEKTWRKTVEGASRVFIEMHYNRHKRLINDVY